MSNKRKGKNARYRWQIEFCCRPIFVTFHLAAQSSHEQRGVMHGQLCVCAWPVRLFGARKGITDSTRTVPASDRIRHPLAEQQLPFEWIPIPGLFNWHCFENSISLRKVWRARTLVKSCVPLWAHMADSRMAGRSGRIFRHSPVIASLTRDTLRKEKPIVFPRLSPSLVHHLSLAHDTHPDSRMTSPSVEPCSHPPSIDTPTPLPPNCSPHTIHCILCLNRTPRPLQLRICLWSWG